MFADRAKIFIRSGKGGDGHVSFRRELYVPDGGPDGGDGGDGGDVIFVVDPGLNTLTDFRHVRKYVAQDGEEGGKRNCHGANGKDIILKVPAGTVVKDAETGKVILDMSNKTEPVTLLKAMIGHIIHDTKHDHTDNHTERHDADCQAHPLLLREHVRIDRLHMLCLRQRALAKWADQAVILHFYITAITFTHNTLHSSLPRHQFHLLQACGRTPSVHPLPAPLS